MAMGHAKWSKEFHPLSASHYELCLRYPDTNVKHSELRIEQYFDGKLEKCILRERGWGYVNNNYFILTFSSSMT